MKSVKPKDGPGEPPVQGSGRNAEAGFHARTTPPLRLPIPMPGSTAG